MNMGNSNEEERREEIKDLLWRRHVAERDIAFLEVKLSMMCRDMQEVSQAIESEHIGVVDSNLVNKQTDQELTLPSKSDVVDTVYRLQEARTEFDRLQESLKVMGCRT